MPFPATHPNLPTNNTDATASPNTHAVVLHNGVNTFANEIATDYQNNAARKNVAAGGGDFIGRLMAKLQTFLGRISNTTNVWSPSVVEIDARTTVQGHPDGGWAAGTFGLYLLPNGDGSPAIAMRLDTGVAGVGMLFSCADGAHQFRFQPSGGTTNSMIWEAETSTGTMRPEFEIPAGAVAGTALAQFNSNMRVVGNLIVGNHFQEFKGLRHGSATYNPASLIDTASATTTVTVTGAVVGDPCFAGFTSITAVGWRLEANVTAADTVSVKLTNNTGGTVDLASGTLRVVVVQPV